MGCAAVARPLDESSMPDAAKIEIGGKPPPQPPTVIGVLSCNGRLMITVSWFRRKLIAG